jgi:hypothetical protein
LNGFPGISTSITFVITSCCSSIIGSVTIGSCCSSIIGSVIIGSCCSSIIGSVTIGSVIVDNAIVVRATADPLVNKSPAVSKELDTSINSEGCVG